MNKKLRVPESCNRCRYNPFGKGCAGRSCRTCAMGKDSLCKCLSMPKGSICPYAEYIGEDTCIICGETFPFSTDSSGDRLTGYSVTLSIWDNTGTKKERWVRNSPICPTCGDQLKKCMEETPK